MAFDGDADSASGHCQGVVVQRMKLPCGTIGASDLADFFRLCAELSHDRKRYKRTEADLYTYRGTGQPDVALGLDASASGSALGSRGEEPRYTVTGRFNAWGRFRPTPGQEFLFDQRLAFSVEKERVKVERLSSTTQTWRGGKYQVDYSYFRYANPYLSLTAGRQQFWWGQGLSGTMLLSNNAPAFDAVSFRAGYKRLGFESFVGILSTDQQRYFSGHRGTLLLPWHLTAGFSEVVLYRANNVDPVYANPLLPFYGSQWNQRDDDNILWNLDLKWTPGHGAKLWGELLMDDVQYEQDPPAPQKLGFLLGGHWADPLRLPDTDLKLEWAGNQKWVYTQRRHENRYVGPDTLSVLGHWIGTDADAFDALVEHRFHPRLNLGLGYGWRRHGEGRVDRGMHYPGEPYLGGAVAPGDTAGGVFVGDDQHTRFLSGTVERQDLGLATLRWEPFFWATVSGRAWWGYTKNPGNQPGTGRRDAGCEIMLTLDY